MNVHGLHSASACPTAQIDGGCGMPITEDERAVPWWAKSQAGIIQAGCDAAELKAADALHNVLLHLIWVVPHSVLARPAVKGVMRRWIPQHWERWDSCGAERGGLLGQDDIDRSMHLVRLAADLWKAMQCPQIILLM